MTLISTRLSRPRNLIVTGAIMAIFVRAHAGSASATPLDDVTARGAALFEPIAAPPPLLQGRIAELATPVYSASGAPGTVFAAQGNFFAAVDKTGKARLWLAHNNTLAADVTAPATRERMTVDWSSSFAFWLGSLPVVAVSWKFGAGAYGIEDYGLWAIEGGGRFLGGLPGSTRNRCGGPEAAVVKECARCAASGGVVPLSLRLLAIEADRARFVQQLANRYHFFGDAAETFEQDFVLTAKGLAPDGQPRRVRHSMPLSQTQERVKLLLREYFALARSQSRASLAPEFLTCFEQLADLAPDFGQAHYNVGCMHALIGNREQAIAAVTKAIKLDPRYRKTARKDPDLATIRDDPELVRLLGGQ